MQGPVNCVTAEMPGFSCRATSWPRRVQRNKAGCPLPASLCSSRRSQSAGRRPWQWPAGDPPRE